MDRSIAPGSVISTESISNASRKGFFLVLENDIVREQLRVFEMFNETVNKNTGQGTVMTTEVLSKETGKTLPFECDISSVSFLPYPVEAKIIGSVTPKQLETLSREHILRSAVPAHLRIKELEKTAFIPGQTFVPVSGPLINTDDISGLVDVALKGWFTAGDCNYMFESTLAGSIGARHVLTTNSGSSALLLAVSALTSHTLGDRRLTPGDEVITVAAGFPTTVNPLLLYGLVPVFVDVDIPTYNVDTEALASAIGPRSKALVLPHTLGNLFDVDKVLSVAEKHGLWVIEDACDALGSRYFMKDKPDKCNFAGSFGDISTFSFFPAHHITMGEGGAVATSDSDLAAIIESFRDWGRDCRCKPGQDNRCGRRFDFEWKNLPRGFDHKYVYSHAGFNLKITEMQAALGLSQLQKLDSFSAQRKKNFSILVSGLKDLEEFLILPEATPKSDPSWFGFPITLRESAPFDRLTLVRFLEDRRIGTRMLFAGNITRQPYFEGIKYRLGSPLTRTDEIMERTFWTGIQPALTEAMLGHVIECLHEAFRGAIK